jgi:hypothetical protein
VTAIRVSLPRHAGTSTLVLNGSLLAYCKRFAGLGAPAVDPGNYVDVSPIEATALAAEGITTAPK